MSAFVSRASVPSRYNVNVIDRYEVLSRFRCRSGVSLLSKQLKSAKKDAASSKMSQSSKACDKPGHSAKMSGKPADAHKFQLYFDFKAYVNAIRPHQVCMFYFFLLITQCLQCFDAVGWAAGRASGL